MTLNRSGTSYRLEWNSRSASAERMSHLIVICMMGMGDTSMYIGHDIFEEKYVGYAYFSDGSWICGDSYYYQGELVRGMMNENEIADINRRVMEAINANDNILHTDYWRHQK